MTQYITATMGWACIALPVDHPDAGTFLRLMREVVQISTDLLPTDNGDSLVRVNVGPPTLGFETHEVLWSPEALALEKKKRKGEGEPSKGDETPFDDDIPL